MGKILTVSIAAYNVSQYITKALDSLIIPDYMDELEVFIVDDGSTDDTEDKVRPYVDKYPGTFNYVRKENGGYGSTVNWSVNHATGKYFKLLDGDDYYNSEGLKNLMKVLASCDQDAVVSQAVRVYPNGRRTHIFSFLDNIEDGTVFDIKEAINFADVAVWGYSFKREAVLQGWRELPEHSFYTDRLFVVQSLLNVTSILYTTQEVYNYRVGHNEQSTSKNSIRKHYKEAIQVDRLCIQTYKNIRGDIPSLSYIKRRISLYYGSTICMLLWLPLNRNNKKMIIDFEKEIFSLSPDIFEMAAVEVKRVATLRKTRYFIYYCWPVLDKVRMVLKRQ